MTKFLYVIHLKVHVLGFQERSCPHNPTEKLQKMY